MNETESIRFQCPHCAKGLRVTAKAAGRRVRCPQCSKQVDVPVQSDVEEESPAPAASRLLWLSVGGGAVFVLLIGLGIWLISGSKKQPEPSGPTQVAAGPTNLSNPVAPVPKKELDKKTGANPEKPKEPENPPNTPKDAEKNDKKDLDLDLKEPWQKDHIAFARLYFGDDFKRRTTGGANLFSQKTFDMSKGKRVSWRALVEGNPVGGKSDETVIVAPLSKEATLIIHPLLWSPEAKNKLNSMARGTAVLVSFLLPEDSLYVAPMIANDGTPLILIHVHGVAMTPLTPLKLPVPATETKVADQPRPTTKQAQEAIDELFKWVVPFGEAKSFFSDQIHEALDGVRKVGATEAAVNRLVEILKNKSGMHRIRALLALEMLGLDSKPAVPVLVELMKQKMTPGRVTTIQDEIWSSYFPRVLAVIGPQAKAAVPTLREALKDDVMRLDAVRALWRIEGQAADLIPLLVTALKDQKPTNPSNPQRAASILGAIGSNAKEAVPALREALLQKNTYVRIDAALALWKIERKTEDGVPVLIDLVQSSLNVDDPIPGQVAAHALGEIGPDAKVAVAALRDALKSKGARLRIAAALALWKVDQRNTDSVPSLMKELSNQSTYPWDRKDAAKAMGVIGPQAKDAIPSLQQALKDNNPDVSKAAARALERIQADPSQK